MPNHSGGWLAVTPPSAFIGRSQSGGVRAFRKCRKTIVDSFDAGLGRWFCLMAVVMRAIIWLPNRPSVSMQLRSQDSWEPQDQCTRLEPGSAERRPEACSASRTRRRV